MTLGKKLFENIVVKEENAGKKSRQKNNSEFLIYIAMPLNWSCQNFWYRIDRIYSSNEPLYETRKIQTFQKLKAFAETHTM